MAIKYLKKAIKTPSTDDHKTREVVQKILNDIEKRKEESITEITKKFDDVWFLIDEGDEDKSTWRYKHNGDILSGIVSYIDLVKHLQLP